MESLLLDNIDQPSDLKNLDKEQVNQLCAEIRQFLLRNISRTGGHLASNLGAVELTVALHRVMTTPMDKIVFDVGHQCYTHKLLTGRRSGFAKLRQLDGISGFPNPNESEHDAFIAGHGIGKGMIHTVEGSSNMWSIAEEELMERITESSKATVDHFGKQIAYINCLRNMSVSCDCEGIGAEPVVTPNIGILASTDILAIDQASVDLVFALGEDDRKALVERITTRHGLRQLTYMKEMGMGNDRYHLIDIDNDDAEITLADAVKDVVPFEG